jgi:acetyl esterase/lipase
VDVAAARHDAGVVRRLGRAVVALLLLVTALGQVLAWTRAAWWEPVLQVYPAQYLVVALGVWRDALGAWNVVLAALLLGVVLLGARRRGLDPYRPLPLVAVAVLVSSVGLWTYQVVDAQRQGADVGVLAPTLPFQRSTVEPDRTVTVGRVDGQALTADLYLPAGAGRSDRVAVVVNVHGGGFTSGSPRPMPTFPVLLDRGYAVLDVSYRLATQRRPTWDLAVADVGCALTWVSARGPRVGLDPERVGTMGDSAGGQLAINAANLGRRLDPSCRSRSDLPRVSAVVGLYPAVDGSAAYGQSALGRAYGDLYVGGSPREHPRRYAFTDSASHVDVPHQRCRTVVGACDGPPLLVVQGGSDHLILPGPVERMTEASRAVGTSTRYVELPGQEHTLGRGLGTVSFGYLVARDLAAQWFEEHLPADGS